MRSLVLLAVFAVACSAGSEPAGVASSTPPSAAPRDRSAPDSEVPAELATAYFAGGCFWGVEHFLEQIDGVVSVESGYMGGHLESPSYDDVLGHQSGHLEAVRVSFDPRRTSYEAVAQRFFEIHDPTQADGQGPDLGSQYRSAVFHVDAEQKRVAEALIARLVARGYDVVTEVRAAERFWPAEDYHQDYYARTDKTPYCHARVKRFGD
jgi:peptide methionine sulfoxide reductase msrA/msrB